MSLSANLGQKNITSQQFKLCVAHKCKKNILCPKVATHSKSYFLGTQLLVNANNGSLKWSLSRWLESRAEMDVPVSLEACWSLWENRELIPQWMPWISSVKVLEQDPRLSKWTLSTYEFGRQWEFSWLARNLQPIKNQKIHWISEPGSSSIKGLEVANRGQIRFIRKGPSACQVSLTISYEVPDVLYPFANVLNPAVEAIIQKDMERFRNYATGLEKKK